MKTPTQISRIHRNLGALAALCLPVLPAAAVILVQTDFDTGYTTGSIHGQSGTTDTGLSGTWTVAQGTDSGTPATYQKDLGNFTIVNGGLSYSVSGGGIINGGSNALQYTYGTASSANNGAYVSLGSNINSDIYVRFLLNVPTPAALSSASLFLWLSNASGSNHLAAHPGAGIYTTGLAAGLAAQAYQNSDSAINSRTESYPVTATTTYLVVAKISKVGDSVTKYNSASIWVNPAYGDASTPDSSVTGTGTNITSINTIGFQFQNMTSTGSPEYLIDGLVIGTTWADVMPAPVPEPSTCAALAGLAALALTLIRRRKRRSSEL
ncbi:PEP-CTERM sorting domain-containing protein [Geminisphaera colitermitum]|uniref:PEP-CTERM sorting domain-containing protein n=1 Tax=Geminisphaera colitermitum TaxID=1148786 RepID=UPI000158CEFC|nr:PEP-CTERM sorting domain-containing protein [Geminisphaera colitermitum]